MKYLPAVYGGVKGDCITGQVGAFQTAGALFFFGLGSALINRGLKVICNEDILAHIRSTKIFYND